MVRMGKVILGKGAVIALTLDGSENLQQIRKAKRLVGAYGYTPLLETRIDRFRWLDDNWVLEKIRFLKRFGLPLIATLRSRREGGARPLPDSLRLQLFKKILPWIDAIDLELSSAGLVQTLVPLARRKKKRVILSYHNFQSTPPDASLASILRKGRQKGADLVKIAVTPRKERDLARFLLFMHRHRDQNLIALAMGPSGSPSRVLAPLFGSLLTYSFIGRPQAPGQLSLKPLLKEMKSLFPKKS